MNVELHIEELVLHGFDPRDRHGIADAVQQELARLVAERGLSAIRAPGDVARLDGGTIELDAARGSVAGAPIARAVHSTLTSGEPVI
jgi:hypothetical protein